MPRNVFTSHDLGDDKCTQLSYQDKKKFKETYKLNAFTNETESSSEEDISAQFGYDKNEPKDKEDEVKDDNNCALSNELLNRIKLPSCNYIKPVPSQLLTVYADVQNRIPIHIELDSGASLNYCEENIVLKLGFRINYNKQVSKLGDGITKIMSVGEINEVFYRNSWSVSYRAVVCKKLSAPFIGGTVFMQENKVEQDFGNNVIRLLNRTITVEPTDPLSLMPTAPLTIDEKVTTPYQGRLLSFNTQWLLPGQEISMNLPNTLRSCDDVVVQPWEQNSNTQWPCSELKNVINGKILLENATSQPIHLGKEVKRCTILPTESQKPQDSQYYKYEPQLLSFNDCDTQALVKTEHIKCDQAKKLVNEAHEKYQIVFNKDLSNGYNSFYGTHLCKLNWASNERPAATKAQVPCYDHDLKVLQQLVMDDLTDQNVLLIPQQHNIQVQAICPSFIQRKQRAKDTPKNQLQKNDVRLLINFGPVNEKIKPVPNHVPKINDIFIKLGRWKHVICLDLYNGYFQLKMHDSAVPWLGVQTPFGGMRVMARAGQGLMGMAEEFEELTSKILKEEMSEGICAKIVDDIYIGGSTQQEAALNYVRILDKFNNANIKVSPEKTSVFPSSVDVLGWIWREGGTIEPSPHRKLALENTKKENIRTIKDLRSWIGLFKTLHVAAPKLALALAPLEEAVAGKASNDDFQWTFDLEKAFMAAKLKLRHLAPLYLPSPHDQLVLEVDACKGGNHQQPGIGHVLFAVKDGQKKIVRLHSAKLQPRCQKWHPCELEALAFATAIEKEQDIIRESKLPLIIMPDSKPVHEAVKMINKGKFSTSARISSFLNNVNRFRIESKHISGKAKLNPISDLQSRTPAECTAEVCAIHRFIDDKTSGNIELESQLLSVAPQEIFMASRQSWNKAQLSNQACSVAIKFLTSGKPPPKATGKNTGEYWNDVRRYCKEASVAKDGTLVVKAPPMIQSGNIPRERIVIPKPLTAALLYHIHNHQDNHPTKSQQKDIFQRSFYAISLDKQLDLLYKNCYKCSLVQKLPKEVIPSESKTKADTPHTHFHADVIKRAKQNILTVKDHFTSYQDAMIIESETAEALKNGLIALTTAIRKPKPIFISVDNSPGFASLVMNKDKDLKGLMINMIKTDEVNKNANAVIDKGCRELEEEIKRIEPDGGKLSMPQLKLAILKLNSKLRRKGCISSYELHTARDQNTSANLNLDDKQIRDKQLLSRKAAGDHENNDVQIGDSVQIKNRVNKHKANEVYIVTNKLGEQVEMQKVGNPLADKPAKLMIKTYKTKQKYKTTHRPEHMEHDEDTCNEANTVCNSQKIKPYNQSPWSPIDRHFYGSESDESEDENRNNRNTAVKKKVLNTDRDFHYENEELSWDHSPEQYAFANDTLEEEQNIDEILRPKPIFLDQSSSISSSSHEDVFMKKSPVAPKNP